MPLESGMVSKAIEQSQTKVEGYNFDIRKHVVEYDDVMNRHRDLEYTERRKIMDGAELKTSIQEMIEEDLSGLVADFLAGDVWEEWNLAGLLAELRNIMPLPSDFTEQRLRELSAEQIKEELLEHARGQYEKREAELGPEKMRSLERLLMLNTMDRLWVHHLTALDEMRQGAGLQGYGGRDPLVVYKSEAHDMWQQLLEHIRQNVVRSIYRVNFTQQPAPPPRAVHNQPGQDSEAAALRPAAKAASDGKSRTPAAAPAAAAGASAPAANKKVGRNDPCPCGSGIKYKKCHGSQVATEVSLK